MKMYWAILVFILSGLSVMAESKLLLADSFKDGNVKDNTVWKSKKSSLPWVVKNNFVYPSGKVIFDSLQTSDFRKIENGTFEVKFKVKFSSPEKTGNNRFSIMLRNSNNSNSGYCATIAQGTSNNCSIEKTTGRKRTMIAKMAANKAFFFKPGVFNEIVFSRNVFGKLTLKVAGVVRMECSDNTYKQFNTIRFLERCKKPDMIQYFADINLTTSIGE